MAKEQQKINRIKAAINNLGPMIPGSITRQFNVCGTPGCKCKDREHPQKHGPYYQLSFTVKGKSSSIFIKKSALAEAKRRVKRFQQFKKLSVELAQASITIVRTYGFEQE